MKILLLEDDPILSDLMYDHLTENGYETTLCMDGQEAIEKVDTHRYDLLLFDINVPRKSGIEVLREIRAYSRQTPAILITAYQDIDHLKRGFTAGCDDYIRKPFALEELDERINNIKKRYRIDDDRALPVTPGIGFDISKRELRFDDGTNVTLSQKEAQILHYFLNHGGRVISPEELIQNIWEYEEMPSDATLRVYIKNLRKHIGKERIKTIRGIGYSFES